MQYLETYKQFENNKNDISFYYNEKLNCLKINELYLFLDTEKAYLESELPVNEGWFDNINWGDFVPQTTSDWIHFSVDVVSGILDFIPSGVTQIISAVIDIIHGMSYFVEAQYDSKNKTSLYIGGAITLIFTTIPGYGNIGNIVAKTATKGGKSLIKTLINFLPTNIALKMTRMLLNFGLVGKKVNATLLKHSNDWWMKGLKKLPVVDKILKTAPKYIDEFTQNASKFVMKDAKLARNAVSESVIKNVNKSYKSIPTDLRKYIPEAEYEEILRKNVDKVLPKLEDIKIDPSKYIETLSDKNLVNLENKLQKIILNKVTYSKKLAEEAFNIEFKNPIVRLFYKNNFTKKAQKQIVEDLKLGTNFNYKKFADELIKQTPESVIIRFAKQGIKKGIPISLKNRINNHFREEGTQEVDNINNTTETETIPDSTEKDEVATQSIPREAGDMDKTLMEKYKLKRSHIDKISDMEISKIVFRTPDKQGEKGKLYLDGGIYDIHDFSDSMKIYESEEELFDDLVKIGKKKADKRRKKVRTGEMNKWEKTPRLSTPYIKALDNTRYEFDFMIRERSKISLATKKDVENLDWSVIFNSEEWINDNYYKINNSLYITKEGKFNETKNEK